MTSVDEQQLGLAAGVAPGTAAHRVAKLQGAVERLNAVAKTLRTVAADIAWSGDAADRAREAFAALAGVLNQHADAVNAVAAADAATDAPMRQAAMDYHGLQSMVEGNGAPYGSGMVSIEQFRDQCAAQARTALDEAMREAEWQVRAAATWDLAPTPPAGADDGSGTGGVDPVPPVTGTVPPGSTSPGGVDPIPPVTGTVPPGSTSPDPGGVDPVPPVTGTVPPWATGEDPGGVDPIPPVTGTVPSGSSSPGSGGVDPTGPITGTVPGLVSADRVAELSRRLG